MERDHMVPLNYWAFISFTQVLIYTQCLCFEENKYICILSNSIDLEN